MQLNITEFVNTADPYTYSHSQAEGGPNAGTHTWNAACNADFWLLDTDDKREAFRAFLSRSGGWNDEEISAMSDGFLNALCIQWIAGDMREPVGFELGRYTSDIEWEIYRNQCEQGQCAGRIWRADDGQVYFDIGV